jgi:hypothetical protein
VLDTEREWNEQDRAAVRWLALLPLIGAAILTIAIFPTQPSVWLIAFMVSAAFAYVSSFLGVIPALFLFRRFEWQHPVHYAIAGFVGVYMPWLLVGMALRVTPSSSQSTAGFLLLPAAIGAVMCLVFSFGSRGQHGK